MLVTEPRRCQINWDDTSLVPSDATCFVLIPVSDECAAANEGVMFLSSRPHGDSSSFKSVALSHQSALFLSTPCL